MCRRKFTFFVLSDTGASVRQATVSRTAVALCGLVLSTCLFALGYLIYDYYHLKEAVSGHAVLARSISDYQKEISGQRRQILAFANKINALKSKLIELNNFEKKIRIIANVETPEEENNLFGIGGAFPEDLDAQFPLTEKNHSMIREMHEQVGQLSQASDKQKQGLISLTECLENQLDLLASTPAIRPTKGWITSRFGYRKSPFTGRRQFHAGLDFAARQGTPIIAPASGVVTFAANKGLMGKMLVINHGHGMVTRYGHIYKFLKEKGAKVKRGETIALVGNTGRSTGPHLHYEVRLNGLPVNPQKYILN